MMSMEEQRNASRLILVAINESKTSNNALQWALNKLITSQDRIILIHAQLRKPNFPYVVGSDAFVMSPATVKNLENTIKLSTKNILAEAMEVCKAKNVTPETWSDTGNAGQVLCKAAKTYKPDMLVMGSHGSGALKRLFLGSVSDYCVHHLECPVVVVKS